MEAALKQANRRLSTALAASANAVSDEDERAALVGALERILQWIRTEPIKGSAQAGSPPRMGSSTRAAASIEGSAALLSAVAPLEFGDGRRRHKARFQHRGDYWAVGWAGRESLLKDVRGMHYLAYLLRYAGLEVAVLDLVMFCARSARAKSSGGIDLDADGIREPGQARGIQAGDAFEIIDIQAMHAYRGRIVELREELLLAKARGDEARGLRIENELEELNRQLLRACRSKNRLRRPAMEIERARLNVTRSIRTAIGRIGDVNLELGRHLDARTKTGSSCSYRDDGNGIEWEL